MTASRSRKSATTGLAPWASSACTGAIFRPRMRTRWPRSSRVIASRFPRKPVPPVTSMFINYLTLKCQCYCSQCQTRACADQQNAIAALYAAALHCFGQREWDGRGYAVAALGQVEKDLLMCEAQAFGELLNGMPAGLVGTMASISSRSHPSLQKKRSRNGSITWVAWRNTAGPRIWNIFISGVVAGSLG